MILLVGMSVDICQESFQVKDCFQPTRPISDKNSSSPFFSLVRMTLKLKAIFFFQREAMLLWIHDFLTKKKKKALRKEITILAALIYSLHKLNISLS